MSKRTKRWITALAAGSLAASGMLASGSPARADSTTTAWSQAPAPLSTPWTAQVSPTNALPDYPRPQLARPSLDHPSWTNLNGLWQYQPWDGYSEIAFGHDLTGQILVPYPTESALSGVQAHSDYMLYRRVVTIPRTATAGGKHVRLNFGAVNHEATVYVNGQQVAHHSGAYEAFSADITSALRSGTAQEVIVAVHSPVDGANIPVGKQRLKPSGIFYTAASGIWQTVWMESVEPTSIAGFTATPNIDTGSFSVHATYNGDTSAARLSVEVLANGHKVASASGAATGPMTVSVPKPHLWTPDDPFLYTFRITVSAHGHKDTAESYAGLRQIAVENVGGKQRITLNHKPTFLLGTLDQGYWPDGIYTAPTDDALKFDIAKTKQLGFNTIRKHIKVEPARWYYWADKLGMMVWQDMPAMPSGRNDSLSDADRAGFRSETNQIVDQLRDDPSVIGWVPFNEGWGQWSVQAAADLTDQIKASDPTRLVDSRSGSNCCDMPGDPGTGDVIDWHVYQGPALPAPDAHRASIDGEHGGLTLPVEGHSWPGASLNPYGAVKDAAALTAGYVSNTAVLRDQGAPYGLSGSIYTQITDVEGEQNGLLTYDRKVTKVDPAQVRAVNLATIAAGAKSPVTPPPGHPGLDGIGAWNFEDGSGQVAQDSRGTNPLTLHDATWVPGHQGTGLHMTGTAYAATEKTVVPTAGANYSVGAWVKFDSLGDAFQTILGEDTDRNSAFFLQYSGADHRLAFSFAGVRALANDVTVKPDTWYHVVGVRDITTSTLTIYVNGQKAGQASALGNADVASGPLTVGRGQFNANPVDYLQGTVDTVRVFDRALSADEVSALYTNAG